MGAITRGRRVGGGGPMTTERGDVVIVGAGLAGARCAEALRTAGHPGRIVLLGEEPHAPYERPALSKDVLTGARDGPALRLRTQAFWDERAHRAAPRVRGGRARSGGAPGHGGRRGRGLRAPGGRHRPACAGAFRHSRTVPASTRSAPSTTREQLRQRAAAGRPARRVGSGLRRPRGRFERDRARCEL